MKTYAVQCPHCTKFINGEFNIQKAGLEIKYCPHCREAYGYKVKIEIETYRAEDY
jgi:Zn-finger nucleic acid-binding protein